MQPSENGNKQIGLADRSFLNSENGMPPGWLLGGQEATHPVRSRQEENSDKNGIITAETEENKRYQSCSGFHFVSLFVLPWYENSSTHSARYQRPKTPGLLTGHGKEQSQANSHDAGVTAREIRHPSMPGRGITQAVAVCAMLSRPPTLPASRADPIRSAAFSFSLRSPPFLIPATRRLSPPGFCNRRTSTRISRPRSVCQVRKAGECFRHSSRHLLMSSLIPRASSLGSFTLKLSNLLAGDAVLTRVGLLRHSQIPHQLQAGR